MGALINQKFTVKGMHCPNCEATVERAVKQLAGVRKVKADYGEETVQVSFDGAKTDLYGIFRAIELKGYECSLIAQPHPWRRQFIRFLEVILALAGIALIFYAGLWLENSQGLPRIDRHLSHGMIFVVGLLTGFHCVGMCGGFIVGYAAHNERGRKHHLLSHFAYGLGKTASYTLLGGLFGLLGGIVTFTPEIRSVAAMAAGLFLVAFGLNMLHLFPHLRIFGFRMPALLNRFVYAEFKKHKSPLVIGLLNGLMIACGPLQAMYVMAAGSGSALEGALIMLFFGLGTLPLMIGFGLLTSLISHRATEALLNLSGILVVALGLIMLNRGLILSGTGYDFQSLTIILPSRIGSILPAHPSTKEPEVRIIHMELNAEGFQPDNFVLEQGVPVRWIIDAKQITECNRQIIIPKLGLSFDVKEGEQVIEFTPGESGIIAWSCWMGMLRGSFIVQGENP
ncbi:MAG: sulfite exporter TauE/SafE family protein [Methylococcaceae bacterium]|nr:sulfite exporter TauE/SafE family protein [Methylococcaceae bacterium]